MYHATVQLDLGGCNVIDYLLKILNERGYGLTTIAVVKDIKEVCLIGYWQTPAKNKVRWATKINIEATLCVAQRCLTLSQYSVVGFGQHIPGTTPLGVVANKSFPCEKGRWRVIARRKHFMPGELLYI